MLIVDGNEEGALWTHTSKSEYYAEDGNEHFKELTKHAATSSGRSTGNPNCIEACSSEESY